MEYSDVYRRSPLFAGIDEAELTGMLSCLSAVRRACRKGEIIFRRGAVINTVGLVLEGSVHIFKDDFWGMRVIIGEASAGDLFGESYACNQAEALEVDVIAAEDSTVLFLDVRRVLTICSSSCAFHARLVRNLLSVMAQKNLTLTRKIGHMAKRSTREKLLSYLSAESQRAGSASFTIPYNRQQLADYLCVDRSAMSGELSRMRRDELIEFHKNWFHLKERSGN